MEIPETSRLRLIDSIDASMDILPDKLALTSAEVNWIGALFQIQGSILRSPKSADVPKKPPKQKTLVPVRIAAEDFQRWEEKLKIVQVEPGVVLNINFMIKPNDFSESKFKYSMAVPSLNIGGVDFSAAALEGRYKYPEVKISRIAIYQGGQALLLSGTYNLPAKELQLNLSNTLSSSELFRFLPESMLQVLEENRIRIDAVPMVEIKAGPSSVKEMAKNLSGGFVLSSGGYQDLEVEGVRGRFKSHEGGVDLTGLQAVVRGRESLAETLGSCMKGGPVTGNVSWDASVRQYRVELDAYCDPHLAVGALYWLDEVTNIIAMVQCENDPPRLHLAFNEHIDVKDSFVLKGHATGRDITFRDTPFSSVDIPFGYYDGGVVELAPLTINQGEDSATGSVQLDFNRNQASFDVTSSLNPATLEQIIYPELGLFTDELKFPGAISLSASGVFDWGGLTNTQFSGSINAEKVETPAAVLGKASADVKGVGRLIKLDDLDFSIYGGRGTGEVSVRIGTGDHPTSYEPRLSIQGADIVPWLNYTSRTNLTKVAGKLYANIHFSADTDKEFLANATGEGTVRIEEGQLADLPFFKGFSSLVRKVYPTFKVFSITRFAGSYVMRGGVISTEDSYFEGNVLSAKMRGSYRQDIGYDFILQTQIFSSGAIGKVVRTVTDPFLKLLEFRVEGDVSNPTWRMVNLPKEVSNLFKWRKDAE
ncbi:MAG: AsmA-like C-terminal region-containing protein [Kiritimatiellales bacterium]|nr:AsmA-like C-terminal region-containing protein [Kiritimatiellales bacterium]